MATLDVIVNKCLALVKLCIFGGGGGGGVTKCVTLVVISLACHFPFSWKLAIGEEMLYSGVRVVAVISNLWSTDISLRPIYRPIFRIF